RAVGGEGTAGGEVAANGAVLAGEPAEPATERQPADTGIGDRAAGGGQAEGLRLAIEIGPGGAAFGPRRALRRIDAHAAHASQIDHQAALAHGDPGGVVPA